MKDDLLNFEKELVEFRKFNDPSISADMTKLLEQHSIYFETEDTKKYFDVSFANDPLQQDIIIKIRQEDFATAQSILLKYYEDKTDDIDKDYYLYEFSNEELTEILNKPDEWGPLDYVLARKILKERGITYNNETLEAFKKERVSALAKPEKKQAGLITFGYIFLLFFWPVTIVFGLLLTTSKKVLPSGERVFVYSEADRKHGKTMLTIAVALTALAFFLALFKIVFQ